MKNSNNYGKKIVFIVILLIMFAFYCLYTPARSYINRIVMLFTSKSVESIVGYIRSCGYFSWLASLGLMIFQGVVIPFKQDLVITANIRVFGSIWGAGISIIGIFLSAVLCFFIGKILLRDVVLNFLNKDKFRRFYRNIDEFRYQISIGVRMLFFIPFDIVSYVFGIMPFKFINYIIGVIICIIPKVVICAFTGGVLYYKQERKLYIFYLIVFVFMVVSIIYKKNKKIRK